MRSRVKIFFALASFVILIAANAYAGKVELTTYYPAPYGEYSKLQSNGACVGSGCTVPTSGLNVNGDTTATGNVTISGKTSATGQLVMPVLASNATAPTDTGSMWIQT